MDELKGNSYSSKEEETNPKKIIEPSNAKITVHKETGLGKFKNQIFQEDIKSVRKNIVSQVIIPGIQKLISESIKNGIEWIIYGVKGVNNKSTNSSNISYTNYWSRPQNTQTNQQNYIKPKTTTLVDISFDDRGEAEDTLLRMREIIERYGSVSVADYYDLLSVSAAYTDNKYGWKDLSNATIERVRDGYVIRFGKIIVLE